MRRSPAASAILVGGSIAGALDITYAIVFSAFRGFPPLRVLQSVASGLLGAKAFDGGLATGALGLCLHFSIALTWTALFYTASRRIPFLTRHAVAAGLLYGVLVYLVMYLIVLPLSASPRKPIFTPFLIGINLSVHMFLIGLPIALAVRRASRSSSSG